MLLSGFFDMIVVVRGNMTFFLMTTLLLSTWCNGQIVIYELAERQTTSAWICKPTPSVTLPTLGPYKSKDLQDEVEG